MSTLLQFSVVIPLYNKRRYIRRAVDSVLSQSLKDFELIVVDDGSTDGGVEVLGDLRDSRLKIIQQVNQGVGSARNKGMSVAVAPWVALVDADDAWLPEHLSELSRVAQAFPDAGLIATANVEAFGCDLPQVPSQYQPVAIGPVDYFLKASNRVGFVNSSSAAVRRTVITSLGGFNGMRAGEDLEYWARIALHHTVAVSTRTTSVYFRDTDGVMNQLNTFNQSKPLKPIEHLSQISSSVETVLAHAKDDPSILKKPNVVAYINSRIENGIKGALYRGDTRYARRLGKLLLAPASRKAQLFIVAAYLPAALTRRLVLAYRFLKNVHISTN